MPFVSVTRLRIRSARFLVPFALHAVRTRSQVSRAGGFRDGSLLSDGLFTFWTLTVWDDEASMREYMTSGAHRTAMPRLLDWCDEASVVHWEQADAARPTWTTADERMRASGRPSKVRNPSPDHATMRFRSPRTIATAPVRPVRGAGT